MGVRASFGSPTPAVPGELAHCELTVENTGGGGEDVRVALVGDAAGWGWANPPTFTLPSGGTQLVTVALKLPRAPEPAPGPLAITAEVTTAGEPGHPVTVTATLDVAGFVDVVASLRPPTSQGRVGRHRLTVENRGNIDLSATIDGHADDGAAVRVEPAQVRAAPGQAAEVGITVRASRPGLRAHAATRSFEVFVRPDGAATPVRTHGAVEVPAGGWAGRVAAILLVLAVAGVALRATVGGSGAGPAATSPTTSVTGTALSGCPGKDHLSPDANGIVRPGIKPLFDYSFLFVGPDGCQPARFNPCAPIHYVLNRTLATDADVADLTEAIAKVSAATGLEFQLDGTSTEDPRNTARPVRGADGAFTWPPVLIGWAHLGNGDSLRPPVTGSPGTAANAGVVGGGGRPLVSNNVIATGNLVLNLDAVTDTDTHNPVPHGFGTGVNWGRIMLHELAHVIGLGHVESRTSIMNETLTQQTISSQQFGVGDMIGLRYLGRDSGCLTVPPFSARP